MIDIAYITLSYVFFFFSIESFRISQKYAHTSRESSYHFQLYIISHGVKAAGSW